MKIRVTSLGLMGAITAAACVLAVWQAATPFWANVAFNLTALAFLVASCKARFSKGDAAAWWFGFALFGWAHLVLGLVGMAWGYHYDIELLPAIEFALDLLLGQWPNLLGPDDSSNLRTTMSRILILHDLVSLFAGFLGGWIVWFFAVRASRMNDTDGRKPPLDRSGAAGQHQTPVLAPPRSNNHRVAIDSRSGPREKRVTGPRRRATG